MGKQKNAKRKHYIALWSATDVQEPTDDSYKWLADGITTVEAENDEETDDVAYYSGDGNPKTVVSSVKAGYSFEGDYIKEDEAQALIASMRFKTGEGRQVWFKVIESDGLTQFSGVATVSDIKIAGGEASEYETFECTITWDSTPLEKTVATTSSETRAPKISSGSTTRTEGATD